MLHRLETANQTATALDERNRFRKVGRRGVSNENERIVGRYRVSDEILIR